MHTSEIKNLLNSSLIMLLLIDDIHLCEDIAYVTGIFRIGPRATHVVLVGDLVPAGTMLVTPAPGRLGAQAFSNMTRGEVQWHSDSKSKRIARYLSWHGRFRAKFLTIICNIAVNVLSEARRA